MKTINLIFATILFCLLSTNVMLAQNAVLGISDLLLKQRLKKHTSGKYLEYKCFEGSPFMFEDFEMGIVKFKSGDKYKVLLQFDKYAGEIQFKTESDVYAIAYPDKLEYIEIDDIRFIFSDFKMKGSIPASHKRAYFEVVVNKECKLLTKKNVKIKEAKPSNGISDAKPAQFIDETDSYFVKIGDLSAIRVKNNRSLISIFEDKKSEISSFIKKEKISSKELDDLKKLVNYYNSLKM